jgi:CRP-like cAMP-binding protein
MRESDADQDLRRALAFTGEDHLDELLPELNEVRLAAGEVLFRVGEPATLVYFLVSGRLAVRKKTGFAEKMQVVALLDPGAPVGEGAVFPGRAHNATVVAVEDCRLVALDGAGLEGLAAGNPVLAWKVINRLLYVTHLRLQKNSDRLARVL